MDVFADYLKAISSASHRSRTEAVLNWVHEQFPQLTPVVKWKQPMFTHHGTFIIGFSVAKNHLAVAPESVTISRFETEIREAGYEYTKQLIRIPWKAPVHYALLEKLIQFNIEDKADCSTFWRK